MKLEDIKANIGVCPQCNHFSSFIETKKKNIYTCHICLQNVEQYVNGKVIYKTITVPGIEISE